MGMYVCNQSMSTYTYTHIPLHINRTACTAFRLHAKAIMAQGTCNHVFVVLTLCIGKHCVRQNSL